MLGQQAHQFRSGKLTFASPRARWKGLFRQRGRSSAQVHRLTLDSLSDGVIVLDGSGDIVDLNLAARRLLGEIDPQGYGRRLPAEWMDWVDTPPESGWQTVPGPGGTRRTYEVRVSRLNQHNRRTAYRVLIVRDVTEARQVEQASRSAEAETQRGLREQAALLLQRNRELLFLQSAAAATSSSLDLRFVLNTVAWEIAQLLGSESCAVFQWDECEDTVTVAAEHHNARCSSPTAVGRTYALADFPERERVLVERHIRQLPPARCDAGSAQRTTAGSTLLLPMIFQERVLGLVELHYECAERTLTDHEISLAQLLATQAASAIENARLYQQAQQEIAERVSAEEKVRASLREKEVLLKEIHHRVKNNLQIISSLLYLQSKHARDPEIVEMFRDSQNRIRSMALIHEKLYQSPQLARIDFAEYVGSIATHLIHSYSTRPITLAVNADDVLLNVDTAVPCGLIVNELISNCLKHAFPASGAEDAAAGRHGSTAREDGEVEDAIQIDLHRDDDSTFILSVADNGVGFPADLDFQHTESLGLQLVNILVKQLGGSVALHNDVGTRFEIRFRPL